MSRSTPGHTTISFTAEDLAAFSAASGDKNWLHLSDEYARRTPYGHRVVFGSLGAIACLGNLPIPDGTAAASIEVEFLRPLFLGVNYRLEISEAPSKWEARLFDGTVSVLTLVVHTEPTPPNDAPDEIVTPPIFERSDAAARRPEDIIPGVTVSGRYSPDAAKLATIAARWGRADPFLTAVLAWSSYLIGMEVPGESALFSKLVLNFPAPHFKDARRRPGEMSYRASVASLDARFGHVQLDVSLLAAGSPIASGQLWSYVRPSLDDAAVESLPAISNSLAGRTAVLVGSSRGLGAAIKEALEDKGAAVYGIARSANADAPGMQVGDAAHPQVSRELRERVSKEHEHLDFLICNACPPILPLRLEPNASDRIAAYISLAISLTLIPLSEFLELLNRSDGCVVIISSAAVENPVREWPHYVAAKQAVEALGRAAAQQYPRVRTLIVRPHKLLTAMTNTPMGRLGAVPPAALAARIAERLEHPPESGKTEIFE